MSDNTTAAAILGTALAVAKPVVETGCNLIENLLGEPCKIAGGMIADQLYAWQWENRLRIAYRAKGIMDKDRIAPRVLPPGFLVPLLNAAGNADAPELQEMWARLIASGVESAAHRHPEFVDLLSRLSRDEAIILSFPSPRSFLVNEGKTPITEVPYPIEDSENLIMEEGEWGRWVNVPLCLNELRSRLTDLDVALAERIDSRRVEFYADHLETLGLVQLHWLEAYPVEEDILEIRNSNFGTAFLAACCPADAAATIGDSLNSAVE